MTTLKMTRGKYRMVLIAMCGLMASSLGVVVNTAGIFFGPIAADLGFGERITSVSLGLTINNLVFAFSGMLVARLVRPRTFRPVVIAATYGLEQTGVAMMSVVLVVNTGGKLLMGAMTDRLGVRRSLLICDAVIAAGILLLMLVRVPAAMLLSAALIGLCYSVPTVGATMICRELFSPERYARVFPKINLGVSVANALGYPLLSAIHGATGGYTGALLLSLALVLATMAAVICVYRMANGKVLSEK